MKSSLLMLLVLLVPFCVFSQTTETTETSEEENETFSVGADIVSRYVWRGIPLSESPAFQPTLSATFGNITLGAWGSYTFAVESSQEADLYLTYTIGNLSLTLNDYFIPVDSLEGGYFDWNSETTRHALEGIITYDGPESFPFQFVAGLFFYGDDKDDVTGDNLYSTYFEVNRTWESGNYSIKPFIGVSPGTGMYSNSGFQVVNMGVTLTKTLTMSNTFKVPLNVSFITNPNKESAFIVLGLTF
jgi:hypothetical protein